MRTYSLIRRAGADLRLRNRSRWDRPTYCKYFSKIRRYILQNTSIVVQFSRYMTSSNDLLFQTIELTALRFMFLWPCIVRKVWRDRKNQQDATIICLWLTSVSTCFGHHYAHLQENKDRVTAFVVLLWFCWMWLVAVVGRCVVGCEQCSHPTTQHPATVTNHIQQNQSNTPNAVTRSLFSWRWA